MNLLGVIGGMSWTSTAEYYRLLNEGAARRLGGLHSARLLLHSLDFAEVALLQQEERWDEAGELLASAARGLSRAGAGALLLATNTMHRVTPAIEAATPLPLIHIADVTARAVRAAGLTRVGLLATRFTMEQDFYRGRLAAHGIETLVPNEQGRADVHRIIYDELCRNVVRPESRERYREIMAGLVRQGAEGMVLGCTEITLLVGPQDTGVPTYDTTALHVQAALDWMLG